ncbi:MAG: ThiF family adenylyltransferase [Saprospiraceae bacterium]
MTNSYSYTEFTSRNIGFVTIGEQNILKNLRIFISGVGGMGSAAIACLARMGIENFIISDIDQFELSNLNRQIFANINTIGQNKTDITAIALKEINPNIKIITKNETWVNEIDQILLNSDIVINGCDDMKNSILLLRKCKEHHRTCIDAFACTFPNVYVVKPTDKRPEEAFNYPSLGLLIDKITPQIERECLIKEIEHVAIHSNCLNYIDLSIAKDILSGKMKRISFAPMVWMTGCLMAYQVLNIALKKNNSASINGIFFNPYNNQMEKPVSWLEVLWKRIYLRRLKLFSI